MSWNRATTLRSFAQVFGIFLMIISGSAKAISQTECDSLVQDKMTNQQKRECALIDPGFSTNSSSSDNCSYYLSRITQKRDELNSKCSKAGFSPSKCLSSRASCDDVADDELYKTKNDFMNTLATQAGISNISSDCPQYSGQDYYKQKDKYLDKIDKLKDKVSDNKKETADLVDSFNKDMQSIQEDIQKAQDELKQKQLDINKDQRQRAAEQAKTTSEVASTIRKKESEILQLRAQISDAYMSNTSNMTTMNDNAASLACNSKANDEAKKISVTNDGSHTFTSGRKKKVFNDTYKTCMAQMQIQRTAMIQKTQQTVEQLQKQIDNDQSDIDNANQQLSTMVAQEQQAKTDDSTAVSNDQNALNQKITRAQQRMTSLAQTTQAKQQALQQRAQEYDNDNKQYSNAMMMLGASPPSETTTASMSDVQAAYEDYDSSVEDANTAKKSDGSACFPNGVNAGTGSSSKQEGSSKRNRDRSRR